MKDLCDVCVMAEEVRGTAGGPPPGFDAIEAELAQMPQVDCPVVHRFTPGLYIREITMPAGTLITSAVHKTQHPFVISKGRIRVVSETEGAVEYVAPYCGVTMPGTRRMLLAIEETVWTTFHVIKPEEAGDVERIASRILEENPNPLLPDLEEGWRRQLLEGGNQ